MNVELPDSPATRTTLEKYLPVLAAIAIAWLLGRGLRRLLWTCFGLYWALHWVHPERWIH
ncbi:MAG: hypothetical protein KF903_03250 [Dokdonella sp.]|uniref:hypothetical protein n=1 Tax=Dokdonella sp. TaxID=2291710 RepID=UPI0025C64D1C|nr:hypothetical protein [Dokdonella sp.]MBX3699999.1 hypothetical protein [Dokdonella sp.]MCW5577275.1 hypothetical protein [Dokdonella sp.]